MRKGERVGRLVRTEAAPILRYSKVGHKKKVDKYEMKCDCGTVKWIRASSLALRNKDRTISCGCAKAEFERHFGLSQLNKECHPLYSKWRSMVTRCYRLKNENYPDYGGRGITVCEEWRASYFAFYVWSLANGWKPGLEIDRKENDGNYEPDNCRYVVPIVSRNNRRCSVNLTAFGETKNIVEWSKDPRCMVGLSTLRARIKIGGWDDLTAIISPPSFKARAKR